MRLGVKERERLGLERERLGVRSLERYILGIREREREREREIRGHRIKQRGRGILGVRCLE